MASRGARLLHCPLPARDERRTRIWCHLRFKPAPRRRSCAPGLFVEPSKLHAGESRCAERGHLSKIWSLNRAITNIGDELHQPIIRRHAAIDPKQFDIGAVRLERG